MIGDRAQEPEFPFYALTECAPLYRVIMEQNDRKYQGIVTHVAGRHIELDT